MYILGLIYQTFWEIQTLTHIKKKVMVGSLNILYNLFAFGDIIRADEQFIRIHMRHKKKSNSFFEFLLVFISRNNKNRINTGVWALCWIRASVLLYFVDDCQISFWQHSEATSTISISSIVVWVSASCWVWLLSTNDGDGSLVPISSWSNGFCLK